MKEKKVVKIEERIPKLKERRKQKSNRRLIVYVSIFFTLMLLIVYFQSSFSQVQTVNVRGNNLASADWVVNESELLQGVSMWNLGGSELVERLTDHDAINAVEISRDWMNTVVITVTEHERIAYIKDGNSYAPVLVTGEIYDNGGQRATPFDAPVLRGFEDNQIREEMVNELSQTPSGLRQRISDILLEPLDNDPGRLTILMNDGFVVSSTVTQFSERIAPYPSVVEQLDPEEEGIVHMRMNPYFERFNTEDEEEEIEIEG
ncbi:FtsQ-type POTRA domain-containing protein [Salipaludibacillus sp. CUR1]|uniref:cell division protein FtsQ/DivIB n=1 Tax=Salipaludibacillus sp. CUR1 TaxID=2820003 RepID=UPI001E366B46|nr:FtsQ-type POTRA domain-containing protein [Salipaludibacillus sp. CUR1]MCE7794698.1 FtsQ-type POTRA domain-containing protein [Salipaludibacillus sp. CUR1]